jgi:hypothetical protein
MTRKIYKAVPGNWEGFEGAGTCLQGLQRTMKSFSQDSRFLADIKTKHLPDTHLEHYSYTSLLGVPLLFMSACKIHKSGVKKIQQV